MVTPFFTPFKGSGFIVDFKWSNDVFAQLAYLEDTYPGFRAWYYEKVTTSARSGERAIFVKSQNKEVLGIAIAKRSSAERKLCTLWVNPNARASGVAAELGAQAFEWLGTTKPLFTVPEERMAEFRGLLNRWDFRVGEIMKGYYRSDKTEYVFNGQLRAMARA